MLTFMITGHLEGATSFTACPSPVTVDLSLSKGEHFAYNFVLLIVSVSVNAGVSKHDGLVTEPRSSPSTLPRYL